MSAAPRAVLFDAVGTLIHLREPVGATYARLAGGGDADADALQAAFVATLRQRAPMVFPDLSGEALRGAERRWWQGVVEATFAGAAVPLPGGAFERLWQHYAGAAAWQAAPGAHAVLDGLRRRGLTTGMVSNFDHRLPAVLAALDLAALLDDVVLPADAGAAKPDARIFHLALARLNVAPAEALYVGDDADDDIAGATAAGLRAIDVTKIGLSQLPMECGA
jgi:putative hydrolase of the HAD superfamily